MSRNERKKQIDYDFDQDVCVLIRSWDEECERFGSMSGDGMVDYISTYEWWARPNGIGGVIIFKANRVSEWAESYQESPRVVAEDVTELSDLFQYNELLEMEELRDLLRRAIEESAADHR